MSFRAKSRNPVMKPKRDAAGFSDFAEFTLSKRRESNVLRSK